MTIQFRLDQEGGFTAADLQAGITAYAHPASRNAVMADQPGTMAPAQVAEAMIAMEARQRHLNPPAWRRDLDHANRERLDAGREDGSTVTRQGGEKFTRERIQAEGEAAAVQARFPGYDPNAPGSDLTARRVTGELPRPGIGDDPVAPEPAPGGRDNDRGGAVMILYRLDDEGGFEVGNTGTGLTSYAYPTSDQADLAVTDPEGAARDMDARQTRIEAEDHPRDDARLGANIRERDRMRLAELTEGLADGTATAIPATPRNENAAVPTLPEARTFDWFEVRQVVEYAFWPGDGNDDAKNAGEARYCEVWTRSQEELVAERTSQPDYRADFWTVYGHSPEGGVEALDDFPDEAVARDFLGRISGDRYADQGRATGDYTLTPKTLEAAAFYARRSAEEANEPESEPRTFHGFEVSQVVEFRAERDGDRNVCERLDTGTTIEEQRESPDYVADFWTVYGCLVPGKGVEALEDFADERTARLFLREIAGDANADKERATGTYTITDEACASAARTAWDAYQGPDTAWQRQTEPDAPTTQEPTPAPTPPTSFAEAKEQLASLAYTIARTGFAKELRIAPKEGTVAEREARAYYTDDIADAVATARHEREREARLIGNGQPSAVARDLWKGLDAQNDARLAVVDNRAHQRQAEGDLSGTEIANARGTEGVEAMRPYFDAGNRPADRAARAIDAGRVRPPAAEANAKEAGRDGATAILYRTDTAEMFIVGNTATGEIGFADPRSGIGIEAKTDPEGRAHEMAQLLEDNGSIFINEGSQDRRLFSNEAEAAWQTLKAGRADGSTKEPAALPERVARSQEIEPAAATIHAAPGLPHIGAPAEQPLQEPPQRRHTDSRDPAERGPTRELEVAMTKGISATLQADQARIFAREGSRTETLEAADANLAKHLDAWDRPAMKAAQALDAGRIGKPNLLQEMRAMRSPEALAAHEARLAARAAAAGRDGRGGITD